MLARYNIDDVRIRMQTQLLFICFRREEILQKIFDVSLGQRRQTWYMSNDTPLKESPMYNVDSITIGDSRRVE